MSHKTTFKPCPFCGGDDVNTGERPHFREGKGYGWTVLCADCGGSIGYIERPDGHFYAEYDTESEAIAAWNARVDTEYGSVPATDENMAKYGWVRERTCRNIAEPDEMSDDPFTCSECGARGPYGEGTYHIGGSREVDGKLVFWDSWPVYKFCPNCGARVIGTEAVE